MAVQGRSGSRALAKQTAVPVEFVMSEEAIDSPFEFPEGFEGSEIAPSGLAPTAVWKTPGEFFAGIYLGSQAEVGPNESMLYSFRTDDGEIVGVWGSVVLDRAMSLLNPQNGDKIGILFEREGDKKPGQNAPKIFRVQKLPAKR